MQIKFNRTDLLVQFVPENEEEKELLKTLLDHYTLQRGAFSFDLGVVDKVKELNFIFLPKKKE
jgi:hypothetical protein